MPLVLKPPKWIYAGHISPVKGRGDYFTFDVAGESLIITRISETEIKAFNNVCRHRGLKYCNCAAIPEPLIDSELFSYAPGAFIGASPNGNRGRILEASGGTLFLDEIGDMPLPLQTRSLRVIECHEVVALGTGTPRKVDIAIIAATHQDLHKHVADGRFRQDLYYRLAGAVIDLPPPRHRGDLIPIIERLLGQLSASAKRLDQSAIECLVRHSWPGNLRELSHVLRRAVSLAADGGITKDGLVLLPVPIAPSGKGLGFSQPAGRNGETVVQAVLEAEAGQIRMVLGKTGVTSRQQRKYWASAGPRFIEK